MCWYTTATLKIWRLLHVWHQHVLDFCLHASLSSPKTRNPEKIRKAGHVLFTPSNYDYMANASIADALCRRHASGINTCHITCNKLTIKETTLFQSAWNTRAGAALGLQSKLWGGCTDRAVTVQPFQCKLVSHVWSSVFEKYNGHESTHATHYHLGS